VSVPEGPTIASKRRDTSAEPNDVFGHVSLLLRVHAEHRWLAREVLPVVRQIETPGELPSWQTEAAHAYLEFA
jgi:hypothetical protein